MSHNGLRLDEVQAKLVKAKEAKLDEVKAKDSDILSKIQKLRRATHGQRQQTKLGQQRLEWLGQARKLKGEIRCLEETLHDVGSRFHFIDESGRHLGGDETSNEIWFQVAGVRKLFQQVQQQNIGEVQNQVAGLQDVLCSVAASLESVGEQLAKEASNLDTECVAARAPWKAELSDSRTGRHVDMQCNLSDEEDAFLEILGHSSGYGEELNRFNEQADRELADLDKELSGLRQKCAEWDDDAHFRFMCVKRQFHGRGRDLFMDRLCLEFPDIIREQLLMHEANCDALKFASQKQAAVFRKWHNDRLALLLKHKATLTKQQQAQNDLLEHRQEVLEQNQKQRRLQNRLEAERARAFTVMEETRRVAELERQHVKAALEAKDDAFRKHARGVKALHLKNTEEKHKREMQLAEEAAEDLNCEMQRKAEQQILNGRRIQLRRDMDSIKQREAAHQRATLEQEQKERAQRMQRAIERLRIEAPSDPERLVRPLQRMQAEAYIDPLVCVTRGPHAGFEERKLMSDARYKLSAALQAAGLYNTPAGQEALARVPAPRPAPPHIVSRVFEIA